MQVVVALSVTYRLYDCSELFSWRASIVLFTDITLVKWCPSIGVMCNLMEVSENGATNLGRSFNRVPSAIRLSAGFEVDSLLTCKLSFKQKVGKFRTCSAICCLYRVSDALNASPILVHTSKNRWKICRRSTLAGSGWSTWCKKAAGSSYRVVPCI